MILTVLAMAAAASNGPAKLVIMPPGQPALIIDYSTTPRCVRARAELMRQALEETVDAKEAARQLGRPVIVQHLLAYCIPA